MNCGCILKCSHFFRNFRAAGESLFFDTASVYRYRELTIVRSVLEAYCQGVFRRPGYLVAVVAHVELIEVCDGEESRFSFVLGPGEVESHGAPAEIRLVSSIMSRSSSSE